MDILIPVAGILLQLFERNVFFLQRKLRARHCQLGQLSLAFFTMCSCCCYVLLKLVVDFCEFYFLAFLLVCALF